MNFARPRRVLRHVSPFCLFYPTERHREKLSINIARKTDPDDCF
jgi:hypothetical protein